MSKSEQLFEKAQKVIPGGVNLFLLRKQRVHTLSTAMANVISIT